MSFPVQSPKQAGYDVVQTPRMSPQVRALWEQLAGQVSGPAMGGVDYLSKIAGGDPAQFEQMEAPAHRQFHGTIGNIASRFSGEGGLGTRHSSGFQHNTTSAAADFAERLQSKRMGLQQDAVKQLLGLYGDLMGNDPYEMMMREKKKKMGFGDYFAAAAPFIGGAAGGLLGGVPGAIAGSSIGSGFSQGWGQ